MIVYRLHSSRYAPNDGTGAALYGGRWNAPGTTAIYTASSRPLAVLEILVHYSVLPRDFVMTEIRIPVRVRIKDLPRELLPPDWNKEPPRVTIEDVATKMTEQGYVLSETISATTRSIATPLLIETAVLRVPSAIVPGEDNYVLNPETFRVQPLAAL